MNSTSRRGLATVMACLFWLSLLNGCMDTTRITDTAAEGTRQFDANAEGVRGELEQWRRELKDWPIEMQSRLHSVIGDANSQLDGIAQGRIDYLAQYKLVTRLEGLSVVCRFQRDPRAPKVHATSDRQIDLNDRITMLSYQGTDLQSEERAYTLTSGDPRREKIATRIDKVKVFFETYLTESANRQFGEVSGNKSLAGTPALSAVELWLVINDGRAERLNISNWISNPSASTLAVSLDKERKKFLMDKHATWILIAERGRPQRILSDVRIIPFEPVVERRTFEGNLKFTVPPHKTGDKDFGGNVDMHLRVRFRMDGKRRVKGAVIVDAFEARNGQHRGDGTSARTERGQEQWQDVDGLIVEEDEELVGLGPNRLGEIESSGTKFYDERLNKRGEPLHHDGDDLVVSYSYVADTDGLEAGTRTGAGASLKRIEYFVKRTQPR